MLVVGVLMTVWISIENEPHIKEFNLSDYQWELDNYHLDLNVGNVRSAVEAKEKATSLWLMQFSSFFSWPDDTKYARELEVYYDQTNACWKVNCKLHSDMLGFVPTAIFTKEGDVLAVYMG